MKPEEDASKRAASASGALAREDSRLRSYWLGKLPRDIAPVSLHPDRPRPPGLVVRDDAVAFEAGAALHDRLLQVARGSMFLVYAAVVAGVSSCVFRHTGVGTVPIGSPERRKTQATRTVGNVLTIVTQPSDAMTFRELLNSLRVTLLEAYEHQEYPFAVLLRELGLGDARERSVLFGFAAELDEVHHHLPEIGTPLVLRLSAAGDRLRGRLEFASQIFERGRIERFVRHLLSALAEGTARPERRIGELELLEPAERKALLVARNDTAVDFGAARCINELFDERAARAPVAVALEHGTHTLSYERLHGLANALASELQRAGVEKGTFVPLLLPRCPEVVIAQLACMRLGAPFVPMDPSWPVARLRELFEADGHRLAIANKTTHPLAASLGGSTIVPSDRETPAAPECADATAEDALYAIYTSGSTGLPKGAVVSHRGVVNRLSWMTRHLGAETAASVAQTSSHFFDGSIWQLYWPLVSGGKTVLPVDDAHLTPDGLLSLTESHALTILCFVPSIFHTLVPALLTRPDAAHALRSVRTLILGGEEPSPDLTRAFMRRFPWIRVTNMYGPTEMSIGCVHHDVQADAEGPIPIGRPIANCRLVVLDAERRLAPAGAVGEIYLTGACMGLGYLNRPERTAEVFVPNPFPELRAERLYATGDLGRWRRDGELEFLGRKDGQVKIRGFRIELGEVEAVLRAHPAVREVTVLVRSDARRERTCVAYVTVTERGAVSEAELLEFASQRLPHYMVPRAAVILDRLPLTPVGKLDRRALAALAPTAASSASSMATGSWLEARVAEVWREALAVPGVGAKDDFFELGGHSLLAAQVVSRLRSELSLAIPLRLIFDEPVLGDFAQALEGLGAPRDGPACELSGSLD